MVYPAETFNPQATLEAVQAERCTSLCELGLGRRHAAAGGCWKEGQWLASPGHCLVQPTDSCGLLTADLRALCLPTFASSCSLLADGVPTMFIAELALPK